MYKYQIGEYVKIVKCRDYPFLIGVTAKLIKSDNPEKYKVDFENGFVGYFRYTEIEPVTEKDN